MKQITNFKELQEGKEYEIYCKPFDVVNKAVFVSHDTTILKRPITYWQFTGWGERIINRQQLMIRFLHDTCPNNLFALWDFDLKNNIISEPKNIQQ